MGCMISRRLAFGSVRSRESLAVLVQLRKRIIAVGLHRLREDVGALGATYTRARCSRKALPMTETEEKLIASAAISGLRSNPVVGYSTPAAIGMPSAL
jgi:hypothetical protein